jgi:murein endopeptidase
VRSFLAAACCSLAAAGPAVAAVTREASRPSFGAPPQPAVLAEPVAWRASLSLGTPSAGRLVRGVRFPSAGRTFFTWDPILRCSPDRPWRRWGSDRLVRTVLGVLRDFAAAHPGAPRVGVGDLSRPHGGDFGPRFGGIGHVSHQNGLDVDVYYPRRDRAERPARRPAQVDVELARDLVDRFVAAGAQRVFVGPSLPLTGPPGVVERLANHDNHLHVRLPAATSGAATRRGRRRGPPSRGGRPRPPDPRRSRTRSPSSAGG